MPPQQPPKGPPRKVILGKADQEHLTYSNNGGGVDI